MSPKSSSLGAVCSLEVVGVQSQALPSSGVPANAQLRTEALMAIPVAVVAGWGHPLPYYHHGVYLQPVGLQQTHNIQENQTEKSSRERLEPHIPIPYQYTQTQIVPNETVGGQIQIHAQPSNTGQIIPIRQQRDSTNPRKRSLVGSVSPLSCSQSDTFESSEQTLSPVIDESNNTMPPSIDRFLVPNEYDPNHSASVMEYASLRTRSRAIAIKRDCRRRTELDENGSQQSSAERMYDWATWRMYNRIVDYRQRHPPTYKSYACDNKDNIEPGDAAYFFKSEKAGAPVAQIRPTPLRLMDYALEDEIFEMDL